MQLAINISQIIQNAAITIALIVGGYWGLRTYRRLREERLSIDFSVNMQRSLSYTHGVAIVSLTFLMKNAGTRELRLAPEPDGPFTEPFFTKNKGTTHQKPAYRNCEIALWRIVVPATSSSALIRLSDSTMAVKVPLPEEHVNILAENSINPNRFWLEPGEVVHIVTNYLLPPGYYTGKIETLFDFRSLKSRTRRAKATGTEGAGTRFGLRSPKGKARQEKKHELRYTFDTFTFSFEVPPDTQSA